MIYNYSISADFPDGLVNHDLLEQLNDSSIAKNCIDVRTIDDLVEIEFDATLDSGEITTMDNIIQNYTYTWPLSIINADQITYNDYNSKFFTVNIMDLNFTASTPMVLDNWILTSGQLIGFDTINGVMTFDAGMYMWGMNIITQTGNNDNVSLRLFNPDTNGSRYFQNLGLNMYIPEGAGGTTFSGANSMLEGEKLGAELTFDLDETATIIMRVNRLI